MTTYERLEEIRNSAELKLENAQTEYYKKEAELANLIGDYVLGAEVHCQAHGYGHVVAYSGKTLDGIIVDVEFADIIKKFSLMHIITVAKFIKFEDIFEIGSIWDEAYSIHNELTSQYTAFERQTKQLEREAIKKAEEEKRAEAKYQATKTKAIKDFQDWTQTERPISVLDEFYYSLGWIAKHAGTITAALPDYLASEFKGYFGSETPCRIVDSTKKGPAGWTSQWAKSFSISLRKPDLVPSLLTKYLNPKGNAITNTDFILDLVDTYGFKFGKEQDIEKIRSCVPTAHISFFENGLA